MITKDAEEKTTTLWTETVQQKTEMREREDWRNQKKIKKTKRKSSRAGNPDS